VRLITALNTEIDTLGEVVGEHFGRHPDAEIYASQPGLGVVLGARVLAEFGDDPHRFADGKARKNYSSTSPITRASGTKRIVLARYARNTRLADALQQWALSSLRGSPGGPAPTTTSCERATSATKPRCADWPTATSASCTAA
jgi:transposase